MHGDDVSGATHLATRTRAAAGWRRTLDGTRVLVWARHAVLRRIATPSLVMGRAWGHVAAVALGWVALVHALVLRAVGRIRRVGWASLRNRGIYWDIRVRRYASRSVWLMVLG